MSNWFRFRREERTGGSSYRRVILLFLTVSLISLMMLLSFTSILGNLKDELALSNTQFGLLLSAFSIAFAIAQIPAGMLSDKYGGKKVSSVGLSVMAIAALAFSFSHNFSVALAVRFLGGFAGGLILPSAVRLISDWYPPRERNMAMGTFGLGQGLGFVVTYVIGSIVVESFGWRMGSLFSGTLISLTAALAWIFLKDTSKSVDIEKPAVRLGGEKRLTRILPLLIVVNFSELSVASGVLQFTPQFLMLRFNFSTVAGGLVTSLVGIMSILASYAGGLGSRKIGGDNVIIAAMLMCTLLPVLLGYSYSIPVVLVLVALLGFATLFAFGPMIAGVPRAVGEKHAGTMFGVFNVISFGASAFSPLILGYILDRTHTYEWAFASLSIIAVAGLGAAVALKRMRFFAGD
jgi:MFS family permease